MPYSQTVSRAIQRQDSATMVRYLGSNWGLLELFHLLSDFLLVAEAQIGISYASSVSLVSVNVVFVREKKDLLFSSSF